MPDKSCDIRSGKCTGLCASNYCGGAYDKKCAGESLRGGVVSTMGNVRGVGGGNVKGREVRAELDQG